MFESLYLLEFITIIIAVSVIAINKGKYEPFGIIAFILSLNILFGMYLGSSNPVTLCKAIFAWLLALFALFRIVRGKKSGLAFAILPLVVGSSILGFFIIALSWVFLMGSF